MKVKLIAECSQEFCNTFDLHKVIISQNIFLVLSFEWPLKTGFALSCKISTDDSHDTSSLIFQKMKSNVSQNHSYASVATCALRVCSPVICCEILPNNIG